MAVCAAVLTGLIGSILMQNCVCTPYYGKKIGDLSTVNHLVAGAVYAVDETTLQIIGFTYDGTAPDTFFWVGEKSKTSSDTPDAMGTIVPDENGSTAVLTTYSGSDIVLQLPNSLTLADIRWLSVWCRQFAANFGHINIPMNFETPLMQSVGEFSQLAHQVRSGAVTVLDAKTIRIANLNYDGAGPDAFFLVGKGNSPSIASDYHKVPDQDGSLEKLKAYSGETIEIRLPGDLTVFDVDWLSIYCIQFTENFGHVLIPNDLNVPAVTEMSSLSNCENLHERLNVAWEINGNETIVQLEGAIEPDEYMAFGLSGSATSFKMIGADVVVMHYGETTGPQAIDYYLNQYSLCSGQQGACPDTSQGGDNDWTMVGGSRSNGVTTIRAARKLITGDAKDKDFSTGINSIVWALGPLNTESMVTKHHTRITANKDLDLSRSATNSCPRVRNPSSETTLTTWSPMTLSGAISKEFKAQIGPSGGKRGYTAITGSQSWGIAWYINGQLIPEITVKRGEKFTFLVEGGNDASNGAQYHPFYITDSAKGGYSQLTEQQHMAVKVFAGVDKDGMPSAAGRYCEWEHMTTDQSADSQTFAAFKATLQLNCVSGGSAAKLEWTPDKDTPDTVYYQCYTHNWLGWKIHVVDEYPSAAGSVRLSGLSILTGLFSVLILSIY